MSISPTPSSRVFFGQYHRRQKEEGWYDVISALQYVLTFVATATHINLEQARNIPEEMMVCVDILGNIKPSSIVLVCNKEEHTHQAVP